MEKQGGGNLAGGSVVDYLSALLNLSQRRLKATDPSTAQFFTCLAPDARTDEWKWLKGVKDNIWRKHFGRLIDAGEELDKSCAPIYFQHICELNRSYAKDGSPEVRACHLRLRLRRTRACATRAPAPA